MKGEVIYLYAFDVANEITTARVQEVLSEKPFPFEIRMDRTLPKDMPLYKPLAIEPPPLSARLLGSQVRLLIRIYDVGVVTVMMRAAFETGALSDLMPFHNPKKATSAVLGIKEKIVFFKSWLMAFSTASLKLWPSALRSR